MHARPFVLVLVLVLMVAVAVVLSLGRLPPATRKRLAERFRADLGAEGAVLTDERCTVMSSDGRAYRFDRFPGLAKVRWRIHQCLVRRPKDIGGCKHPAAFMGEKPSIGRKRVGLQDDACVLDFGIQPQMSWQELAEYDGALSEEYMRSLSCPRPPKWCVAPGHVYKKVDCVGDGVDGDHFCWDLNTGSRGAIKRGNNCVDTWPNEPMLSCPRHNVPPPIDCGVTPWSNWSACSDSCGGGTRWRTRNVSQRPFGGRACPTLYESESCNTHACPPPPPPPPSPPSPPVYRQAWSASPSIPVTTTGFCGPQHNRRCPMGQCCTVFNYCGASRDHCSKYRRPDSAYHGAPARAPAAPAAAAVAEAKAVAAAAGAPVHASAKGRCGPKFGHQRCKPGQCCSRLHWCGASRDHCVTFRRSDSAYHG